MKKDVAKHFNISPSTLSNICAGRRWSCQNEFPCLEEYLTKWILHWKGQNGPIVGFMLPSARLSVLKNLLLGLAFKFKKRVRHYLSQSRVTQIFRESDSVDNFVCSGWIDELMPFLKVYDLNNIFNTNETGFSVHKYLPDRTLTFETNKFNKGKLRNGRIRKLETVHCSKTCETTLFQSNRIAPTTHRSNKES